MLANPARPETLVWAGEHVVLPDPAPPGFTMPPALPLLDTIVGLTLVAAHISSIKVASGIIVLPLRNPVVLAKELARADGGLHRRAAGAVVDGPPRLPGPACLIQRDRRLAPAPAAPGPAVLRRAVTMANGWYGFYLDLQQTRRYTGALRQLARECDRPAGLGRLELTVTPSGPLDKAAVEQYAELGVDRLVLLPQPDAGPAQRHAPVPVDRILRNIDTAAGQLIST